MSDLRERTVAMDKARVWHPYTEMSRYQRETEPLVVVRGRGSRLEDADGREILDGNASWWTATLGHNHPRLTKALETQMQKICHTALAGIAHPGASELAEEICAVAPPGLEHVFYSDNGSTSVEVAMKLVLQYWAQNGRPRRVAFVALEEAFHGETLGVTALGGVDVFRDPFAKVLLECQHIPSPASEGGHEAALARLAEIFEADSDRIAALVVEPMVQGAAGMRMYSADFLRGARRLCDQFDIFLVCDEVFTGYGRTGRMWASQHAGISPDILCTAKGFSGGMFPMAATLRRRASSRVSWARPRVPSTTATPSAGIPSARRSLAKSSASLGTKTSSLRRRRRLRGSSAPSRKCRGGVASPPRDRSA